jgi:hypothetical protein
VRFTETVALEGLTASIGSVGDTYDALAKAFDSLYEAELIRNKGPWTGIHDLKDRDGRVHRLVQPPQAPRRDRPPATGRDRERFSTTRHPIHQTDGMGLTDPPLNPGLDSPTTPPTSGNPSNPGTPGQVSDSSFTMPTASASGSLAFTGIGIATIITVLLALVAAGAYRAREGCRRKRPGSSPRLTAETPR